MRVALTDRGRNNQVILVSYQVFKTVSITNKKTVVSQCFFLGACFTKSALNSIGPLQGSPQGLKGSLQGASWQVRLLFKRREISRYNDLMSFDVTRCIIRCHSLYHSLSFIVTRCCHSMLSLDVSPNCLFINDHKRK